MLLKPDFWKKLKGEKILIHQFDAFIFKNNIDEFLEYDYLGSPCYYNKELIINGGFSLRNKNKMIELLEKNKPRSIFEDIFFSRNIEIDKSVCERFSFQEKEMETFGTHQFWKTREYTFSEMYEIIIKINI